MSCEIIRRDLFLFCHKPQITRLISRSPAKLLPELAAIVADYITGEEDCFGAKDFQQYFNVFCETPRDLPFKQEFYNFWHGTDPLDASRQRCETHCLPFIRPQRVITLGNKRLSYNFETFKKLVKFPVSAEQAFKCCGLESIPPALKTEIEELAWVVARKGVLGRGKDYYDQRLEVEKLGRDYKPRPSVMDLVTLCATEHFKRGRWCLGDEKGEEKQPTYSTSDASIIHPRKKLQYLMVGNFSSRGLNILLEDIEEGADHIGILAVREFKED